MYFAIKTEKSTRIRFLCLIGRLDNFSTYLFLPQNSNTLIHQSFQPPRHPVSYTPQVPQLLSATLGENLRLGLEVEEDWLKQAIALTVFEQDLATMNKRLVAQ